MVKIRRIWKFLINFVEIESLPILILISLIPEEIVGLQHTCDNDKGEKEKILRANTPHFMNRYTNSILH